MPQQRIDTKSSEYAIHTIDGILQDLSLIPLRTPQKKARYEDCESANQRIDELVHEYFLSIPNTKEEESQEEEEEEEESLSPLFVRRGRRRRNLFPRKSAKQKRLNNNNNNKFAISNDVVQDLLHFHLDHQTLEITIPQLEKRDVRYELKSIFIDRNDELSGIMMSENGEKRNLNWDLFLSSNTLLWSKDDLLKQVGVYHKYELPDESALNPESLARAHHFALYAKQATLECVEAPGWVVCLSANWQNIQALLRVGVPCCNIIHFEREKKAAALIKLIAARKGREIHTLYCGSEKANGVEDYIIRNKFEEVFHLMNLQVRENIVAIYLDYCGNFQSCVLTVLFSLLPKLKMVMITQSKRGIENKARQYDEIVFPPSFQEQKLERFDHQRVTCRTYKKKGLTQWTGNVGTSGRYL
jgi:hypothetical protein